MRRKATDILVLLALMPLVAGGCVKNDVAWVAGTVVFDGSDVPRGTVRFLPSEGAPGQSAGAEIIDGRYEVTPEMAAKRGLRTGRHRILVTANRNTGEMYASPEGEGMVQKTQMYIPSRYNRETVLQVELEPGTNVHNLTLVADPKPETDQYPQPIIGNSLQNGQENEAR